MKKINFIDLFAGCGGLSEGFLKSGHYNGLAHVEWEKPMIDTLRYRLVQKWNHSEEDAKRRVIQFDIQKTEELFSGNWSEETKASYSKLNSEEIESKGMDGLIGDTEVDVIIGGPPCQAYSIAGRAQDPDSMKNDYRNFLFESYARVVNHYRPKLFVFENVPGLLSAEPGNIPVRQRIYDAFEEIGYEIRTPEDLKKSVFCSVDFNTPQVRNRVIIFGVRKDTGINIEALYEALTEQKMKGPHLTVKDAIGNYPKYRPLNESYKKGNKNISHELIDSNPLTHHNCRYSNFRDQKVFKEWISNNMNQYSNEDKQRYYTKITGNESVHIKYRNLEWDKPSPTVVAHLHKDGLMFIHPDVNQLRTITIREAASLQTFPEDFEFKGSDAYAYKMIGNAVPVEFARSIAEAVYKVLKEYDKT
jgi:DNA (cytosine-5)-methyltransferase 1